jgi:Domain of unknown function (DUF5665)
MDLDEEKLIDALGKIRRDKYDPWRYLLFTMLNGMAWGLGVTLGMTIVLALVIFILTKILAQMINFPVIGYYIGEITKLIDAYIKQGPRIR